MLLLQSSLSRGERRHVGAVQSSIQHLTKLCSYKSCYSAFGPVTTVLQWYFCFPQHVTNLCCCKEAFRASPRKSSAATYSFAVGTPRSTVLQASHTSESAVLQALRPRGLTRTSSIYAIIYNILRHFAAKTPF